MIALYTDFGSQGPYVGQLHAVLANQAQGIPVVDLFHDVPSYNIRAGAYLLPSYVSAFPAGTVFVCVVDPGVGSDRRAVYLKADDYWYVGPDNGLFQILARRARQVSCYAIDWRPQNLSHSFHGRDLFAPVAAMLSLGQKPRAKPASLHGGENSQWPDDLAEVVYIDRFGNATTGFRATALSSKTMIRINKSVVGFSRTYSGVAIGEIFWYENANGLVEIAVNQGSAAEIDRKSVV